MSTSQHDLERPRSRRVGAQALALTYRFLTSPTIRILVPFMNPLMHTSSVRPEAPPTQVVLDFSLGWGIGETHEWYIKQPTKTFVSLEYRKQKEGLRHEFVVVRLNDRRGTLCRFDRMANDATRAYGSLDEGTAAKDTALILTTKDEVDEVEAAEILLRLSFPGGEDLLLILATCYSLKTHPLSNRYQLFLYNCYFFSWTITCVAARRAVDWGRMTGSDEPWTTIIKDSLKQLVPATAIRTKSPTSGKRSISARTIGQLSKASRFISFKPKRSTPCNSPGSASDNAANDILDPRSYEDKLKELLYKPLVSLRQSTKIPFQRSLFRSQLAPTLKKEINSRVWDSVIKAPKVSAALAAGTAAMKEVTNLYPREPQDLSYQGRNWNNYCDVAWAVAYEAAAAAEVAQPDQWAREWDRAWQLHWGRTMKSGDSNMNSATDQRICEKAKAAWRAERTGLNSVGQEFISEVISTVHRNLLARFEDIDDKRMKLGERAAAKAIERLYGDLKAGLNDQATQPPFQDYMRMRMQRHFERVENFGVRSQAEAMEHIEDLMREIWVKTLDVLEGKDISSDGNHLGLVRMS